MIARILRASLRLPTESQTRAITVLVRFHETSSRSFYTSIRFGTSVVIRDGMLDKDLKEKLTRLFDRVSEEAIAMFAVQPEPQRAAPEPLPEWMTASQLARYWQLVNAKGEPTTAAIMKWTKRSESEHPLPYSCMGDLLRFRRDDVDRWAQEEATRRKAQSSRRKLHLAS